MWCKEWGRCLVRVVFSYEWLFIRDSREPLLHAVLESGSAELQVNKCHIPEVQGANLRACFNWHMHATTLTIKSVKMHCFGNSKFGHE